MRIIRYLIQSLSLFVICYIIINGDNSIGSGLTQEWHTSASCKLILSIKDKWNIDKQFKAKYIVKLSHDLVFMAERDGVNATQVIFPDDFFVPGTNQKAWIDFNGKESVWEIYVNEDLLETGTFSFKRSMMDDF